jgi:hypothetical protein
MAPTSNSAKALQQNRPWPAVPKGITPVLPLPYTQKRKQQVAAREKAGEETAPPAIEKPPTPTPPATEIDLASTNGTSDNYGTDKVEESAEPLPESPAAPTSEVGQLETSVEEPEASTEEESTGEQTNFLFFYSSF